ncbi:MAG: ergothioneine biosynthesis protein EgtB [Actinomycetota bacterium]|nr:ergothioneine biosynthesis protein EgtB [Actinomycetota bacterium]
MGTASASFQLVRDRTEALAAPLSPEDQVVQSMPDCSPTKWHRAHTTWFLEEFVLDGEPFDPAYRYLWNSYYEAVGPRHPRPHRGLLTRPSCDEVRAYREAVDERVVAALEAGSLSPERLGLLELGRNHEEQHQELLLMDAKHLLFQNPLRPAYVEAEHRPAERADPAWGWVGHEGGVLEIGHDGRGFAFDNEGPRHEALVRPFGLADRLVTAGEWLAFMADDGYRRADLWLADGWGTVQAEGWEAPLYWEPGGDAPARRPGDPHGVGWTIFTLAGRRPVDPAEPVVHVSYYEADAYARWAGHRLPSEVEWEAVAHPLGAEGLVGNFLDDHGGGAPHPRPAGRHRPGLPPRQLFGDVWEWTSSPYGAYPGFHPAAGAVGEYNGKFMVNQHVLRGGGCATPSGHTRTTYRNFFPPGARWAFAGVRLACDDDPSRSGRSRSSQGTAIVPVTVDVVLDPADWSSHLAEETRRGLSARPAWTPPVWFYDDAGSVLFDEITRLDEYYPTRAERSILEANAAEIAALSGAETLVELGSGTSEKTRLLLDGLAAAGTLRSFVPFDVSEAVLRSAAEAIAAERPGLAVHAVVGDFTRHLDAIPRRGRRLVAFLGGTIGNFDPDQRVRFLFDVDAMLEHNDAFLLGTDLVKDPARLVAAYDDRAGVTAAFDRNALRVLNRELGADFDPEAFDHVAHWDPDASWIEMRLVARSPQRVRVPALDDLEVRFEAGEWLRTEISAKFTAEGIRDELWEAGLVVQHQWTDPAGDFLVSLATPYC